MEGLKSKEIKLFNEMLIKANIKQVHTMKNAIWNELTKRGNFENE